MKFDFDFELKQHTYESVNTGLYAYDPHGIMRLVGNLPDQGYALVGEYVYAKAEQLDLEVVEADDNTLQLDFDTEEQWDTFISKLLPILLEFVSVNRVYLTESVNGNKHVYIKLKTPLPQTKRIAFQAALGSDPARELLALISEDHGKKPSVVLFEKSEATEVVFFATDGYQPQLTNGSDATTINWNVDDIA